MKAFIVTVSYAAPLIGTDRVEVEAHTHAHATLLARGMRAAKGWPRGSTYTPRLRDESTFDPSSVDSNFALFGALPAVRC